MKYQILVVTAIFILMIFGSYGIYFYSQKYKVQNSAALSSPSPTPAKFPTASPTPTVKGQSTSVNQQPEAGSNTANIKNLGINVIFPIINSKVTNEIQVKGFANVETQNIQIEIKDELGNVLGSTKTNVCFDLDACPFTANFSFNNPSTKTGTLELFSTSQTNNKIYETIIPITF